MREYTKEFPIHDIPKYPHLLIRSEGFVFKVDKETGEVLGKMTLQEYVQFHAEQMHSCVAYYDYYVGHYYK